MQFEILGIAVMELFLTNPGVNMELFGIGPANQQHTLLTLFVCSIFLPFSFSALK